MDSKLTRRVFLRGATLAGAGLLAACAPKVIKETVVVEKQVEKVVQQTVVVTEKVAVEVEKEVTRVVKEQVPAQPAPKEIVTLQLHHRAGGDLSEPAIYVMRPGEFMKTHPNIKIELAPIPGGEYMAKVQTMAASATLGDVMWSGASLGDHTRMMRQGIIAIVDDHLEASGISKDEWLPAAVELLSMEGKMYGLPKCCHPAVAHIWLNKDMFEAAGLSVPETYGNSHADLIDWASTLAQGPVGDRQVYGYGFGDTGWEYIVSPLRSFGGYAINKEGTESLFDSPEAWEWAQWTNRFFREDLTPIAGTLPTGSWQALFAASKIPMVAGGRWMHKRIVTAVEEAGNPFEWTTIQVPRAPNASGWCGMVDTHSATTFTKHPEEAFLLTYAMADQRFTYLVATTQGYLTGRVDDGETIAPLNNQFLNLQYTNMTLEEANQLPANTRGSEFNTVMSNELQRIWLGDVDLTQDVLKEVKAACDEVIEKPF